MKYYNILFPNDSVYNKNDCMITYYSKKYNMDNIPIYSFKKSVNEYLVYDYGVYNAENFINFMKENEKCSITGPYALALPGLLYSN
jgi:hypothetical protein